MKALGFDPDEIKYVLISHAHSDHVGGASYLQDRFNAKVIMSEADWKLLEGTKASWRKPRRELVATDGQKLTLGEHDADAEHHAGHTLGTISSLIPGARRVDAACRGVLGRHGVQLGRESHGVHHARAPRQLLVQQLHPVGAALPHAGAECRRRRDPVESHGVRRLEDQAAGDGHAQARRYASVRRRRRFGRAIPDRRRGVREGRLVAGEMSQCLNCGADLGGPFCAACGQRSLPANPTVSELVGDAWREMSGYDGRIAATFRGLMHPGQLTRDYLQGRRAEYLPPVRLYLIVSVIYFLVAAAAPPVGARTPGEVTGPGGLRISVSQTRNGGTMISEEDRAEILKELDSVWWFLRPMLKSFVEDPDAFRARLFAVMPRVFFGMLPVFAAIVAFLYRGRRFPRRSFMPCTFTPSHF